MIKDDASPAGLKVIPQYPSRSGTGRICFCVFIAAGVASRWSIANRHLQRRTFFLRQIMTLASDKKKTNRKGKPNDV